MGLRSALLWILMMPPAAFAQQPAQQTQEQAAQPQQQMQIQQKVASGRAQISVRTDKGIYRAGERPKISGRMLYGVGNPATGFARIQVNRKVGEKGTIIYDSIVEVRAGEFADENLIVQIPRGEILQFATRQIEYWIDVTGITDKDDPPKAYTQFTAEEVGVGGMLSLMAVPFLLILYMLLQVFPSFMRVPTKQNAKSMLTTIYILALIFLFIPLMVPLVVSVSSDLEALLRTTPVGFLKASMGRVDDLQWVVNIGGVPASGGVLKGGLGIPLLVLVISTLGAAINMLRKLPDFLRRYDQIPDEDSLVAVPGGLGGELRGDLLKYLVYIISAPFIAMAAFSLMLIADYTNPHAVAIVAFSVGFISDTVVEAILEKSRSFISGGKNNNGAAPVPKSAEEPQPPPKAG